MSTSKVWYITGASKGIGFSLVQQLLAKGHLVAATSRHESALQEAVTHANFLPLQADLTNEESIGNSIGATIERFGRIDIVVNNAGYGTGGALEELSSAAIQENFDINLFAVIKVIRQALPHLRQQRSGHIINISSIAGFAPGIGWSIYSAAKFAVSGLSEALAHELEPLGIHITTVSPGAFRTNFLKPDSIVFTSREIADYQHIRAAHQKMHALSGNQAGDPEKVADALLQLVEDPHPPVNLFLGTDAYNRATAKIEQLTRQMENWKAVSLSTDFTSTTA